MQKTKLVLIITALTLVVAASVAVTFAQFANAQTTTPTPNNGYNTQAPYGYNCPYLPPNTSNGINTTPQPQGCYQYGTTQGTNSPCGQNGQYGMGMGMHGRIW